MEKTKILITGSTGRVGSDLVGYLQDSKKYGVYDIWVFNKGDILNDEMFRNAVCVIHLAALTPKKDSEHSLKDYIETNVEMTKKILALATKNGVRKIVIPTSWSWRFKAGNYQYSKLLQEKAALEYTKQFNDMTSNSKNKLNVMLLELPEVIHKNYKGILTNIAEKINDSKETVVDAVMISTITTEEIAEVCKLFIESEGSNDEALKLFRKSVKTFKLYDYIFDKIKVECPNKLRFLKKGAEKSRNIEKRGTEIVFPMMEY